MFRERNSMIDYSNYEENEEFMEMLDYLRGNCLLDKEQLADETDIDREFIEEYFDFIQSIVSEEIREGEINDAYGSDVAEGYLNTL